MNEEELARNTVATDYAVHDLNVDPRLPYEDNSFDVVTNAVSVDCARLDRSCRFPPFFIGLETRDWSPLIAVVVCALR